MSKIITKFNLRVVEYDSSGYYFPKYKTDVIVIAETADEAKDKAIERTDMRHSFGGDWVQKAIVLSSEDIVMGASE